MSVRMQQRMSTSPLAYQNTTRPRSYQGAGDTFAGFETLAYSDLLFREDSMTGEYRATLQLGPMPLPLLNTVYVRARAWFVPHTALERYPSIEAYIASYNNEPERDGMEVVPNVVTTPSPGYEVGESPDEEPTIFAAAGYYAPTDLPINADVIEAYNCAINYERRNLAPGLTLRDLDDVTLARSSWVDTMFRDAKLTFDAARIHGEVTVGMDAGEAEVHGLAGKGSEGGSVTDPTQWSFGQVPANQTNHPAFAIRKVDGQAQVYADLEALESSIRLGEIDQARVIARLADIRDRYAGHEEEHLITDLMRGFSVPPQALQYPMLLAEQTSVFAQAERKAMDGPSLDIRQIDTQAMVNLRWVVPQTTVGGIVMVLISVQPEQMFFGSFDPGIHPLPVDERPDALADTLDIYKVKPLPMKYVRIDHGTPESLYGFVPMNHHTALPVRGLGGRFRDQEKEDRAAVWSVDFSNPSLNEDGYLVPRDLPRDVFADQEAENVTFMYAVQGAMHGVTQFGVPVIEETGSYEAIRQAAAGAEEEEV